MKNRGSFLFLIIVNIASLSASALDCAPLFSTERQIALKNAPSKKALHLKSDLRLMNWNLKDFYVEKIAFGNNIIHQENPVPNHIRVKPEEHVNKIREIVEEVQADILVLNEVIGERSSLALDRASKYDHIVETPKDVRGLQTTFMIAKSLQVESELYFPRAQNEEVKLARGLPTLLLRQKGSAKNQDPDLIVMGLHLKAPIRLTNQEIIARKRAEIRLLLEAVKDLENHFPNSPIVLLGDFNLHLPKNVTIKNLHELALLALEGKVEILEHEATHSKFKRIKGSKEPVFEEAIAIDHIVVNKTAQNKFLASVVYQFKDQNLKEVIYKDLHGNESINPQRHKQQAKDNPSDHKPLISEIDMTQM